MDWNKVLPHIQPRSAQALFSQQFWLIEFANGIARIGCGSDALLKQGRQKISSLQSAMTKAGYSCEIRLEIAPRGQTASTPSPSPVPTRRSQVRPRVIQSVDRPMETQVIEKTSTPVPPEDEVMQAAVSLASFFSGVLVRTIEE